MLNSHSLEGHLIYQHRFKYKGDENSIQALELYVLQFVVKYSKRSNSHQNVTAAEYDHSSKHHLDNI